MRIAAVQALKASSLLQPSAAAKGDLPSCSSLLLTYRHTGATPQATALMQPSAAGKHKPLA